MHSNEYLNFLDYHYPDIPDILINGHVQNANAAAMIYHSQACSKIKMVHVYEHIILHVILALVLIELKHSAH